MHKLPSPASQENAWHEVLPGIRILFRPIGRKAWRAAQRAAARVLTTGAAVPGDDPLEDAGDEISYELLYRGIVAWEGVVGDDEEAVEPTFDTPLLDDDGKPVLDEGGKPIVDRGTISAFLSDPIIFRACDRVYVTPYILRMQEKNALSASPSGTGEAETLAADTVSSRAAGAKGSAAKRARTKSTTPRPKKGL